MKTGQSRRFWRTTFACAALLAAVAMVQAADRTQSGDGESAAEDVAVRTYTDVEVVGPFVPAVVNVDLRQLPIAKPWKPGDPIKEIPRRDNRRDDYVAPGAPANRPQYQDTDPLLKKQAEVGPSKAGRSFTTPELSIAGLATGTSPGDPSGSIGKDYYIQVMNAGGGARVAVFNKADGTSAAGPFQMDSLGSGSCGIGAGDGVVLYDHLAERWLLTEFSGAANVICMYVSQTSDPITGGWFAYSITAPSFPDYPKYGVWPDAYYVSSNEFSSAVYAIDRPRMLAGLPATSQRFSSPNLAGFGFQALTPLDMDGQTLPPTGTPNYFMRHRDDEVHNSSSNNPSVDFIEMWEFSVDFDIPANSTFSGPTNIAIAEIDSTLCGLTSFNCFPQPSSGVTLDPLREVVMFPASYRNFGTHQSILGTLVTDVAVNRGGLRWFELRRTGTGPWSLHQEGTYSPDADNRFMSSGKMDGSGNIAIGYSVTSSATHPSIRYHGRLSGDPLGTLPGVETELATGNASNSSNRWGDYSQMSVDPVDDCTFWYTMAYNPSSSIWASRIGRFKFDECGEPGFTLAATNTEQAVCAPGDLADIEITLGQVAEFTGPVTLSLDPQPVGFSASFTSNPVAVPGSSTATISVSAAASEGVQNFDILGTASGATDRVAAASVEVFKTVPAAPALFSPSDGAINVTSPTFTWSAVPGATSYLVEVATDAAFTTIVDSGIVSTTSYNGGGGAPDTIFYWRVTPSNLCGTGATSGTFSYRSSLTICRAPALPINDNSTTTDTMTLVQTGTIEDLDLDVDLDHTFLGNLDISLEHLDTGTSVRVYFRACSSSNNMDITFDDESGTTIVSACTNGTPGLPPGAYIPFNALSAFDGESLAGDWLLSVTDVQTFNTGTLNEWCITPAVSGSCGDNTVDPGEECDDGNTIGGDGCDANCQNEVCGNGIVQTGEECDDGNTVSDDGCSSSCDVEFCGDDTLQVGLGEQCDDGNTTAGDGCDANCLLEVCGNGVLQAGEQCDDGNGVSGDGCSAACVEEFCGDNTLQIGLGEECDDGNTTVGDGCDENCINEVCGNGIVQTGEQCDDGNAIDTDACSNSCTQNVDSNLLENGDFENGTAPWVFFTDAGGSYQVVGGEARLSFTSSGRNVQLYQRNVAADSNTTHTISFRARHTQGSGRIRVRFGNHVSPYQSYGISQNVNLSGTMTEYSFDFDTTSDLITDGRLMFLLGDSDTPGESIFIDDVVLQVTAPDNCGNGVVDVGETCDASDLSGETCGSQGFDGGTLACNSTCDAFVTSACFVCGDNVINGAEVCDGTALGGETCSTQGFNAGALGCAATCDAYDTSNCSICGDGNVDAGEECDDSNTANGDGCDSQCRVEVCGNGIVQVGEQCDDGNVTNGDGCDSSCTSEICGNGVLQAGEQCDDNNVSNGDGCDSNCINEICGNGVVQAGEQCDDGNSDNNDACSNACTTNVVANLLDNGDFSGGSSPWTFYTNGGGSFQVVGGEARLNFTANGSNVQLYQRGIGADSLTDYTLTFRARHSLAGRRITVRFAKHGAPYTFYGLSERVNLTTSMQTYTLEFTSTSDLITDARLMFLVSDADTPGSQMFIDDVVLAPSAPSTCGNGVLDAGEACDGFNLGGQTCASQGFDGGALFCNATCSGFVTDSCFGCGDGVVDAGEVCDGADLDGETCATQGFDGGTLSCNGTCSAFVTSSCSTCGNGVVEGGESCDDGNTNNGDGCSSTCQTEGGGPNLVVNGNFSAGTSGWFFASNANSSFSVVGGEAFIDVNSPGTSVQLYQRNVTLQPNTTYRLTLRGRNTGGDNVRMRVIRHTSPYNSYGLDQVINLTPTMSTFTMTFTTPNGPLADARVQFWIAPYDSAGDDYYFDDIVLEVD